MNKSDKIIDGMLNGYVLELAMAGLVVTLVAPLAGFAIVAGAAMATAAIVYCNMS